MAKDFTPAGTKMEGAYENDRNACYAKLYEAVILECWNVVEKKVICAHHLTFITIDRRDGFDYQIVHEIPSADALIFDHEVAKKIWGEDLYLSRLAELAVTSVKDRDELLSRMYYGRSKSK